MSRESNDAFEAHAASKGYKPGTWNYLRAARTWHAAIAYAESGVAAPASPAPSERRRTEYTPGGQAITVVDAAGPTEPGALRTIINVARILAKRPRPMCRDCADEDGTCPNTGLPCDLSAAFKAAEDALAAYAARRVSVVQARLGGRAPNLLIEHEQWAVIFGAALVGVLQGDYAHINALAKNLKIIFPNGAPRLYSDAIAAHDAGVKEVPDA